MNVHEQTLLKEMCRSFVQERPERETTVPTGEVQACYLKLFDDALGYFLANLYAEYIHEGRNSTTIKLSS